MNKIIYSVLLGFLISSILGLIIIPLLKKLNLGQNISEDGPKSHKKKAGIPTFGGIIFIFSSLITLTFLTKEFNKEIIFLIISFIAFALIGFADDYLKKVHKKNEGLTSGEKMLLLLFVSGILAVYAYFNSSIGSSIVIPFAVISFNLGIFYIPFIIFFYAATTNAVNLTDGLDGLATSVTLLVMAFFSIVSFSMGYISISVFCGCVSGSLLGFLKFNSYPARVIMGDTGSLALGGLVATVAVILKNPLIILIVGGVYALETLSVVIQVASYKLTGKRPFKMAPIHHGFELSGWHEAKIVTTFSIATALLCLIAYLSF